MFGNITSILQNQAQQLNQLQQQNQQQNALLQALQQQQQPQQPQQQPQQIQPPLGAAHQPQPIQLPLQPSPPQPPAPVLGVNHSVLNQFVQKERFRKNSQTWSAEPAAVLLLLRGGFFVGNMLTKTSLTTLLRKIAFPTTDMIDSLLTLHNVDIANFSPPLPTGWSPTPCTFIVHLETFQKAFTAVIDDGTTTAGPTATSRRELLKVELNSIIRRAQNYLSLHSVEMAGYEAAVKARLITDTNADLNEYLGNLGELGRAIRVTHDFAPPNADDMDPAPTPAFPRLRALTSEGSIGAIIAKLDNSIAGLQPTKRKSPPAGGQSGPPASRQRASTTATSTQPPAPPQNPTFQQELLEWGTPHRACHAHWKGQQCRRSHCALSHTQVHPGIHNPAHTGPPGPPPGPPTTGPPGPPPGPPPAQGTVPSPTPAPAVFAPAPAAQRATVARYSANYRPSGANGTSN